MENSIKAVSIEQNVQEMETRVWFDVDGISMAVSESGGFKALLDHEGYPMEKDSDLTEELYAAYDQIAEEYCGEDCTL